MGVDPSGEAQRRVETARSYGRFQACYVHFDGHPQLQIGVIPSVLIVTKGGLPRIRELLMESFKLTGPPDDVILHHMAKEGLYRVQQMPLDREGVY